MDNSEVHEFLGQVKARLDSGDSKFDAVLAKLEKIDVGVQTISAGLNKHLDRHKIAWKVVAVCGSVLAVLPRWRAIWAFF